ncbi:uncharacterized protein LOC143207279 [Lasioglossum baleicum]|uniref:uncharacterized protein LOC143207279 n=1 Tax=Lasioglossum baleicum TaxID=434251 RepID=UPI003FCC7A62
MDQECHPSIYNWFEKSGMISNIRTHLRQNLINALRNKDVGLKTDHPKSAKQYIYDLLIAEYLFNHNYAYTLSVFASEAPLLINFSDKTAQRSDKNEEGTTEKLQNDYVLHALETLGINPHDAKGQYVISQYIESDMPLLLCILKCITLFSYNMYNGVPIKEHVTLCNESTQTKFSWLSYNARVDKLVMLKRKISLHKQIVNNKVHKRETMLKEQALLVEEHVETLNTKLQQVQNVMRSMSLKEKELEEKRQSNEQKILQKEMELALKERLLLQEENRLQREQNDHTKREEDLKHLQGEKKAAETAAIQNLQNIEVQTDFAVDATQEQKIEVLTKEKEELNALIQDQQLRIEQITQRAVQLSRQIEEIRALRPANEVPTQTTANTIVSESSSTEDILQDAKMRLKRLEEESLKADQYYYNFIHSSP